jgi:hypothetical protein
MTEHPGALDVGEATRVVICAIYCRLSQFGGKGIDRQEKDCRQIVAARGWMVGEVFREIASANPNSKKAASNGSGCSKRSSKASSMPSLSGWRTAPTATSSRPPSSSGYASRRA